jgi:hypothetical protein
MGGPLINVQELIIESCLSSSASTNNESTTTTAISTDEEEESSSSSWTIRYQVQNPGYFTFPVSYHLGSITFDEEQDEPESASGDSKDDAVTACTWTVEFVPYRFVGMVCEGAVLAMLTLAMNRWETKRRE